MRLATRLRSITGGAIVAGAEPVIDGAGAPRFGREVCIARGPIAARITVGEYGECEIGDRVFVGHGVAISCDRHVSIGADSRLGAFVMIYDSDFHRPGSHDLRLAQQEQGSADVSPVRIGARVRIGAGTVVLRGAVIGDDAVIDAGSVIWGVVPAKSRAHGSHKVLRPLEESEAPGVESTGHPAP